MRLALTALTFSMMWQAAGHVGPEPEQFRFERSVAIEAGTGQRACAVLDAEVYAHALAGLADVRLFAGGQELPYATTMSQTAARGDVAEVLNAGQRGGGELTFDLRMPERAYSDVTLAIDGVNFVATAKVTGLKTLRDRQGTELGKFTLFDLSDQRLGRSTTLRLGESTFPFLHVELAVAGATRPTEMVNASMVTGAEVPPSREAQTIYTSVAATTSVTQRGQESVAVFEVPAHVPVERVAFEMAAGDRTNFSRSVRIGATALTDANENGDRPAREEIEGGISRVRMMEAGQQIRQESLGVAAIVGSNGQAGAKIEVAVENGDDRPLAIRAVRLEMRERKLCFDVPAAPVTMFYGDAGLGAPLYDYSRLFHPADIARAARLEAEAANAQYVARVDTKPFTERHPELLWVALFAVVSVLGVVAFRSVKRV